jgi:hypothetical protein
LRAPSKELELCLLEIINKMQTLNKWWIYIKLILKWNTRIQHARIRASRMIATPIHSENSVHIYNPQAYMWNIFLIDQTVCFEYVFCAFILTVYKKEWITHKSIASNIVKYKFIIFLWIKYRLVFRNFAFFLGHQGDKKT